MAAASRPGTASAGTGWPSCCAAAAAAEIALARRITQAREPAGLPNPGKVLPGPAH